jgi:hypothetical protein
MPLILAVLGFVVLGLTLAPDPASEHDLYCEMVQIHHETSGEYGWPPYKGECPDE